MVQTTGCDSQTWCVARLIEGKQTWPYRAGLMLDTTGPTSSAAVCQYRWRPDLSTGLIREGELEGHPILRAHHFRDVTFARRVFDKVDIPRPDGDLFPSRNFELSPAAQRDHVLAAWGPMPIGKVTTRRPMELGPGDLHHLEDLSRVTRVELQFYFVGMR